MSKTKRGLQEQFACKAREVQQQTLDVQLANLDSGVNS